MCSVECVYNVCDLCMAHKVYALCIFHVYHVHTAAYDVSVYCMYHIHIVYDACAVSVAVCQVYVSCIYLCIVFVCLQCMMHGRVCAIYVYPVYNGCIQWEYMMYIYMIYMCIYIWCVIYMCVFTILCEVCNMFMCMLCHAQCVVYVYI